MDLFPNTLGPGTTEDEEPTLFKDNQTDFLNCISSFQITNTTPNTKKPKITWKEVSKASFERYSPYSITSGCNDENAARRASEIRHTAGIWGGEIVEHCVTGRGPSFVFQLAITARRFQDWNTQALPRFQQLICRRIELSRSHGRRKWENPLESTDLRNARSWADDGPYVKKKDPERVPLPLRLLNPEELPSGYCFDQYGLIRESPSSKENGGTLGHAESTEDNTGTEDIVMEEHENSFPATDTITVDCIVDTAQDDSAATADPYLADAMGAEYNNTVSHCPVEPIDNAPRRSSRTKTTATVRPLKTKPTQEQPFPPKIGRRITSDRQKAILTRQLTKALSSLSTSEPAASTEAPAIQEPHVPERKMLEYDQTVVPAWDPSDQQFLKQAISEIHERANATQDSRGRGTAALLLPMLQQCKHPATDTNGQALDLHLLSGREAHALLESCTPDIPILTQQQQHFQWENPSNPIEEFFDRMECLGTQVCVQIPSRDVKESSSQRQELLEVKRRLLNRGETDDPWNVLDCRCPIPNIQPGFLTGRNCQLLSRVREGMLGGEQGGRVTEGGKWKHSHDWALLSEGGHCTAPHMDSDGLSTWITVQQGRFGFAWMSRPTDEQREEWMQNPSRYDEGQQWRYWVLKPGQTVFFPSGTIHAVFRIRREKTLALGGHILQWTNIGQWLDIVAKQDLYPDSTNEDLDNVWAWVRVVVGLVQQRVKYAEPMDESQDQAESSL